MATKRSLDGSVPAVHPGGPPASRPEYIVALHHIVTEYTQAGLQQIADELHRCCGVGVCPATISRALRAQGIVQLKPVRRVFTRSPVRASSVMATRQRIDAKHVTVQH